MAMYMFQGKYSTETFKHFVSSPQDRTEVVRKMVEALGGKLHHLFFAFGEYDVVAIIEHRDNGHAAAQAMAAAAGGALSGGKTTLLMTYPEAVESMKLADKAMKAYEPPKG